MSDHTSSEEKPARYTVLVTDIERETGWHSIFFVATDRLSAFVTGPETYGVFGTGIGTASQRWEKYRGGAIVDECVRPDHSAVLEEIARQIGAAYTHSPPETRALTTYPNKLAVLRSLFYNIG